MTEGPIFVVELDPVEANPGESGGNDGAMRISLKDANGSGLRAELGRVGFVRRTSKWKTKSFGKALRDARQLADDAADELNRAHDRAEAAKAAAAVRRDAAVRRAREAAEADVERLQAQMDARLEQEDTDVMAADEAEAADPEVVAARGEVERLEGEHLSDDADGARL